MGLGRRRLALVALAALIVFGAAIAIGRSVISSPPSSAPDEQGTTGAPPAPNASPAAPSVSPPALLKGFVTVNDPEAGFSIAYPRTWKRLSPSDKGIRLLVADGTSASLLVRVAPVGLTVTPQTLGIVRDLTDRLVAGDRRVKQLSQPQPITLDGLPGYRYLYTFGAGRDGRRGAHVHYFLFRRKRLITIVLQVPGVRALKRDSVLLNRVAGTFRTQ